MRLIRSFLPPRELVRVLRLAMIMLVALTMQGCIVTAIQRMADPSYDPTPTAGVMVVNSLTDTLFDISTTPGDPIGAGARRRLKPGESVRILPLGALPGSRFAITVKCYDLAGEYVGMSRREFVVSIDSNGRYSDDWSISRIEQPVVK
jgi:hypothetical protein